MDIVPDKLSLVMWETPTKPIDVPLNRTGIAWETDKSIKFKNPTGPDLKKAFERYAKPMAWKVNVWELDLEDPHNNGFENEDFIVWMRTAALPTFRKLYRKVNHNTPNFVDGLRKANYTLTVEYSKY